MTHPPSLVLPDLGVPHGFFTRAGGVSQGGYASLNASLSGGDDRRAVLTNRGRIADALDVSADLLLGLTQVHGAAVITVGAPWGVGEGARADAMVTDRPGIALGIITADCAPVLFADAAAGVIGAAHAGWRGALSGILEATMAAMTALGARAISAVIGPCIGQPSYQVGGDLRDDILAQDAGADRFFTEDGATHWRFDLPGYCAARIAQGGITAVHLAADTYAEPDRFFSHRRRTHAGGGVIGHQMSVIRR